jgi:methionine-rich copper-binding protein CopC
MRRLAALLLPLALLCTPALGSTKLQSSEPTDGARVGETARITLRFSGALQPALSGARLVGPSGKTVPVATAVGVTAITLLPFQLKPGQYHVDWHSMGQDKSKARGSIAFTVVP